jgi:autotransporter-associated beta strand protein
MKTPTLRKFAKAALSGALLGLAVSAQAASQTWTNEPATPYWITTSNWIANAVPGAINLTGNAVNNDIATFTNAIPLSGIGGASNPIQIDDWSVSGGRSRQIGGLTFDIDAGAHVFAQSNTSVLYVSHNNTTRINAPVTNRQTFTVPVRTRLPSSTNGRYTLLNNATNTGAIFFFQSFEAMGSGATRPLTLVLDGVNTGTNTLNNFGENGTSVGATYLYKDGPGTWVLTGVPQTAWGSQVDVGVTGGVHVVNGSLLIRDAGALGVVTPANVVASTNGTLVLDGVTLNQTAVTVRAGGTIRGNGTLTLNGLSVANVSPSSVNLTTTSASDVLTVGGTGSVTGGGPNVTLNVGGSGLISFATANTYAGNWSFNSGTNQLVNASALGTGPSANIAAGAILDLTPLGAVTYAPTVSGLSAAGTGTTIGTSAATLTADAGATIDLNTKNINLTYTPVSFSGDNSRPALYVPQGTLSLGNNSFSVNNASGTPLGNGTYRLIEQASGSVASAGGYAVVVTGSGVAPGSSASIQVTGGNVELVVFTYVPKNLVWTGGNSAIWDNATSISWLNGASPSVFNTSDNVLFNSVGSTNPTVSISGTVSPGSITANTSGNDYTINGSGSIGGATSLAKVGTGVLTLGTVNSFTGGTVVSNGTLRLGVANAIPSSGSGALAVYSVGTVDMNGVNNTVNGLIGDGVVDVQNGGTSTLTIGFDNSSSTFAGRLTNSSGTLNLTKVGTGTATLSGESSVGGQLTVDAGTVQVAQPNSAGGSTATVAVNVGSLLLQSNLNVGTLNGNGGTIANAAGSAANRLKVFNGGTTATVIADGVSGTLGVDVLAGTLRFNSGNSFSGGTTVAEGAALHFGNSGQAGSGGVIASNNTLISMPTGNNPAPIVGASFTTAAGARVQFSGGNGQNAFSGQFIGSATSTNVFTGFFSASGAEGFSNFLGTVIVSNGASIRLFHGNGGVGGGDNTSFVVNGGLFSRDQSTIKLGSLTGTGDITAPSVSAPATWLIGAKGLNDIFSGRFNGSNNLVKVGSGSLTLDGVVYGTNVITLPDSSTMEVLTNGARVFHTGNTTVSNGTLRLIVPNNLTNSPAITLAGASAVLDATKFGYTSNQTTLDINSIEVVTNSIIVTNGVLGLVTNQLLNGLGTIQGSLTQENGSSINVGLPIGALTVTGSANLAGIVNFDLNRTNAGATNDLFSAAAVTATGTINVTNLGSALQTGDSFKLFSVPVSGVFTLNLPATGLDPSNNVVNYTWTNRLAIDGSVAVLSGYVPPGPAVNPNPTNITATFTTTDVTLAWPASHIGWTLQVQTNARNVGLTIASNTWFDVTGSAITNSVTIPTSKADPTVFYRLRLPQP